VQSEAEMRAELRALPQLPSDVNRQYQAALGRLEGGNALGRLRAAKGLAELLTEVPLVARGRALLPLLGGPAASAAIAGTTASGLFVLAIVPLAIVAVVAAVL
jgi:hypothetical protein